MRIKPWQRSQDSTVSRHRVAGRGDIHSSCFQSSAQSARTATKKNRRWSDSGRTHFENLPRDATGLILKPMQLSDFFNVGGDLVDTVKIVFFRMLPRGAQIQKVRAEINSGLLKKYGRMTKLEIDNEKKTISADLDLKGEKESVRITLSNYRIIQEEGENPRFEPGAIEVSREWLDALLKTLVKTSVIPERMEIKNLLHQTAVKSLLQTA
jgi:hypothetical protein